MLGFMLNKKVLINEADKDEAINAERYIQFIRKTVDRY